MNSQPGTPDPLPPVDDDDDELSDHSAAIPPEGDGRPPLQ